MVVKSSELYKTTNSNVKTKKEKIIAHKIIVENQ